jgi:hypothetical protein
MSSPRAPYRVVCSEVLRQQLRQWGERAHRIGIGQEYAIALRDIWERLSNDPLTWGDPLFNLHHLDLLVFRALHPTLQVQYAIHQVERIVFVQSIVPRPGSPFNEIDERTA